MSVSIPSVALPGAGISSACGWPHARAPACKDQHCSSQRLFDLLGTPRKGRTDPFMRYVVEEQCVEDNADPSLLPKKAWWGLWFSWTGQTPDSLLLNQLVRGLRTLPFVCDEVPQSPNREAQREAEQADEVAAASSTTLEIVKKDKRTLIKEAAEGIDTLLLEQVQNKNRLGIEDRKNDLDLIKSYQKALRVVHAAPDPVFGVALGLGSGAGVRRLRQASQPAIVELTQAPETQTAYSTGARLSEIDDEDGDYELVDNTAPSLRSRATTVEEVFDSEEPVGPTETCSSQKGKAKAIEPTEEKTFRQAWEELKVVASGIQEIAKPEDSLFQKTCLTILNGFDKFLGFVPFLPLAVNAIRWVCYEARAIRQEAEWRNRNAVRRELTKISAAILATPDEEELDMSAVDSIKRNQDEMAKNMAIAAGHALQQHTRTVTNTVTSHIDAGTASIQAQLNEQTKILNQFKAAFIERPRTDSTGSGSTLVDSRPVSPELLEAKKKIAEQEAENARLKEQLAKSEAEKAQQAETIANLAAAMSNMNNVNRNV